MDYVLILGIVVFSIKVVSIDNKTFVRLWFSIYGLMIMATIHNHYDEQVCMMHGTTLSKGSQHYQTKLGGLLTTFNAQQWKLVRKGVVVTMYSNHR
jgi:hypothetical protein